MNLKIQAMPPVKVLIVEDDEVMQVLMRQCLEKYEIPIKIVGDIAKALEFLKAQVPQLVITDYNLPDGNGVSFTRKLHKLYPSLPVIACSSEEKRMSGFFKVGAKAFFQKPIYSRQFGMGINTILEQGLAF